MLHDIMGVGLALAGVLPSSCGSRYFFSGGVTPLSMLISQAWTRGSSNLHFQTIYRRGRGRYQVSRK